MEITSMYFYTTRCVDGCFFVPLDWISQHDDDFGPGLNSVDEVLSQERWLCLLPVSVEIAPGLVVPHSGCAGFSCQDTDSLSITLGNNSSFKMQ